MANASDYGNGYLAGMLTGFAVGVGLGMLFAPRTGLQLRGSIARSASDLGRAASETCDTASATLKQATEKVKTASDKVLDIVTGKPGDSAMTYRATTTAGEQPPDINEIKSAAR